MIADRSETDEEYAGLIREEEQLLVDYRNLYWTRLMCIADYELDQERKWPMGPDLVEEC